MLSVFQSHEAFTSRTIGLHWPSKFLTLLCSVATRARTLHSLSSLAVRCTPTHRLHISWCWHNQRSFWMAAWMSFILVMTSEFMRVPACPSMLALPALRS